MSLRLYCMAVHTPGFILRRELDAVALKTIEALESLIQRHVPLSPPQKEKYDPSVRLSLQDRRLRMAYIHNEDVAILVHALGREQAAAIGRPVLYEVGKRLGGEARSRLAVGDSMRDLLRAATIMYRVLGIDFTLERSQDNVRLHVCRCTLASRYSSDACLLLSAVDEGVVEGLNPHLRMSFTQRMTDGGSECLASVFINKKGGLP